MEVVFNEKTGFPEVRFTKDEELSKKDLKDARAIGAVMRMEGWKVLETYWEIGRESILDAGKNGLKLKDTSELSNLKLAILKGWDECRTMASRIISRVEQSLQNKSQEVENETADD